MRANMLTFSRKDGFANLKMVQAGGHQCEFLLKIWGYSRAIEHASYVEV